jgi:aryl-alcohol dehydrogenase-like predicted oxidoreductase
VSFVQNIELVHKVEAIAAKHSATPGQIALAWLHAQVLLAVCYPKAAPHVQEANRILCASDKIKRWFRFMPG